MFVGPKIVKDGLVLALDAANAKSYPGTGTTWEDLSGNNNCTLTNGPTFDSENGVIVFDGTNDLGVVSQISAPTNTSTSIEVFMRFNDLNIMDPTTDQMNYILSDPRSGNADGHQTRIVTDSNQSIPLITYKSRCQYNLTTELYIFYGYIQILGNGMNNYPTIFRKYYNSAGEEQTELFEVYYPEMINGNFFHYIWSLQNSDLGSRVIKHYLNGNEISGVYGNHTQDWNLFNIISIRIFERSNSSVSVFRIYDRPLSEIDSLKNYNAQKTRFGL